MNVLLRTILLLTASKRQPLKLDYLWASLCIMGAVYFMFRGYRVA